MSTAARWVLRLAFLAAGLAVIAAFLLWLALRASLPQLDGEAVVDGIGSRILVERDDFGIPTLTASNRRDLAFATGYVHGQDRYVQMDLMRRSAAGELSALVGPAALPHDRRLRLHRFRARAERIVAAQDDESRGLLAAYAAGVNAALAAMSGPPAEYRLLRSRPTAWVPADSLLIVYAMFVDLNDERADRDLARGLVHRVVPPEVFAWLYPEGTRWDAPVQGDPRAPLPLPGPELYDLREYHLPLDGREAAAERLLPGSNNWAVGGALTEDGRAIVANDMHLGLRVPNIFYRARLVVDGPGGIDVSGVTLPGTPVVVAGSNGRVAWGFTNSYGDWSDAIVVHAGASPDTYLAPDGERAFETFDEVIAVNGGPEESLRVRETIWGPVREDVVHPEGELAVSWIAQHVEAVNIVQLELERVGSVEEALGVANRMGIPPQNFVSGDADGNIGWTIAGRIPLRDHEEAELPVDGRTSTGFRGWLAAADYPRIVNPPGHRIWTANARVVDGEWLDRIGDGGYDLGARALQIRDGLLARERFQPADMLAIHLDDRALFLQHWRDLLLSVLDEAATAADPERARFRALVEDWEPRASVDSVGYRLVREFRRSLRGELFRMLTLPVHEAYPHEIDLEMSRQFEAPAWQLVSERPPHLLPANVPSWRHLLLTVIDRDIEAYAALPGGLEARRWGERNTARIRHPLSPGLPWLSRWLDMPRDPLPGDSNMPRVQSPTFGASERFAVSPGAEQSSWLHMPAGQSGHPLSPYYRRGHDAWVEGRATPFLPGPARHRLTLSPR